MHMHMQDTHVVHVHVHVRVRVHVHVHVRPAYYVLPMGHGRLLASTCTWHVPTLHSCHAHCAPRTYYGLLLAGA